MTAVEATSLLTRLAGTTGVATAGTFSSLTRVAVTGFLQVLSMASTVGVEALSGLGKALVKARSAGTLSLAGTAVEARMAATVAASLLARESGTATVRTALLLQLLLLLLLRRRAESVKLLSDLLLLSVRRSLHLFLQSGDLILLGSSPLLGLAIDLLDAERASKAAAKTAESLAMTSKALLIALSLGSGELTIGKTSLQSGDADGATSNASGKTTDATTIVDAFLTVLAEAAESPLSTLNTLFGAGNPLLDLGNLRSGETLLSKARAELGKTALMASKALKETSTTRLTATHGPLLLVRPALNVTSSTAVELPDVLVKALNLLLEASLLLLAKGVLLKAQFKLSETSLTASNARSKTSKATLAALAGLAALTALARLLRAMEMTTTAAMTAGLKASMAHKELLQACVEFFQLLFNSSTRSLNGGSLVGVELARSEGLLDGVKITLVLSDPQDKTVDPLAKASLARKTLLNAIDLLNGSSHGKLKLSSLLLSKSGLKEGGLNLSQLLLSLDQSSLELSLALRLTSSFSGLSLLGKVGLLGLLTESLREAALNTADTAGNLTNTLLELLGSIASSLSDLALKASELSLKSGQFGTKSLNTLSLVSSVELLNLVGEGLDLSHERFLMISANVWLGKASAKSAKASAKLGELGLSELDLGSLLVTFAVEKSKESADLL